MDLAYVYVYYLEKILYYSLVTCECFYSNFRHQHVCQMRKWIPFNGTISSLEKDVLTSKIHVLYE